MVGISVISSGFLANPANAQDAAYDYARSHPDRYLRNTQCDGELHPTGIICIDALRSGGYRAYMTIVVNGSIVVLSISDSNYGQYAILATLPDGDVWARVRPNGNIAAESYAGALLDLQRYFSAEYYVLGEISGF